MCVLSGYADMVHTAIREKADVIFSGAGLPFDLPSYLTADSTTKLVPIVSSLRAAKIICDKWQQNYGYLPDAIVVERFKAGGISTGEDIACFLQLGAAVVQMGSIFVTTWECDVNLAFKEVYLRARAGVWSLLKVL